MWRTLRAGYNPGYIGNIYTDNEYVKPNIVLVLRVRIFPGFCRVSGKSQTPLHPPWSDFRESFISVYKTAGNKRPLLLNQHGHWLCWRSIVFLQKWFLDLRLFILWLTSWRTEIWNNLCQEKGLWTHNPLVQEAGYNRWDVRGEILRFKSMNDCIFW